MGGGSETAGAVVPLSPEVDGSPPQADTSAAIASPNTAVDLFIGPSWQAVATVRGQPQVGGGRADYWDMNHDADADLRATAGGPSLKPLRIAAAAGALVAVVLVVLGFSAGVWYGIGAILLIPVLPMVFVLAIEATRRR